MHFIAAYDSLSWYKINHNSEYDVSLDITDSVLQWTPLQYAIKLEKWDTVERLLESNGDRSGLDMIKQRAHEPGYIDPIILEAARCRHLLLIEFGVKIRQSRIRGFFFPLLYAIEYENLAAIRFMIQLGADCNIRNRNGQTHLFIAVTVGSLDVVRILVEGGGASVDVSDNGGTTVTEVAVRGLENAHQSSTPDFKTGFREKIVEYLEGRMSEERK
jgi:ankyrin repeat protein